MTSKHEKKERKISQIENGTVIDHINTNVVFQVVRILGIGDNIEEPVTVGANLKSNYLGKKGIIKIAEHFLTQDDVNKLSVVSPNATVNIIQDYEVVEKFKVEFPKEVRAILRCPNPNCVTNKEGIETRFRMVKEKPILLFCTYCERYIRAKEIEII